MKPFGWIWEFPSMFWSDVKTIKCYIHLESTWRWIYRSIFPGFLLLLFIFFFRTQPIRNLGIIQSYKLETYGTHRSPETKFLAVNKIKQNYHNDYSLVQKKNYSNVITKSSLIIKFNYQTWLQIHWLSYVLVHGYGLSCYHVTDFI